MSLLEKPEYAAFDKLHADVTREFAEVMSVTTEPGGDVLVRVRVDVALKQRFDAAMKAYLRDHRAIAAGEQVDEAAFYDHYHFLMSLNAVVRTEMAIAVVRSGDAGERVREALWREDDRRAKLAEVKP